MAQVLNKDPITYQKERDGFLRELQHFHETRGTPFRRVPQINGQEIDLYLLYVLVTAHGGWLKVNGRNEWDELMEQFKLPSNCVNSGVALKQVYLRYLDRYEKVHFLGDDGGRGSDDDDDSRHKRWSARALHAVPLTYNSYQHVLSESQRAYHGLSTDLYKPSDYDRLAMSLMSPLPNEQDFAINVCTLLSNEGRHTLKLDKCPRLVDFLLAHAAVFNHEGTRELFQEVYGKVRHSSLTHFWADVLEDPEMHHLADETQWPLKSRPAVVPSCSRTESAYKIGKERCRSRDSDDSDRLLGLQDCAMDVDFDTVLGRRNEESKSKTDSPLERRRPKIDIEPSDLELFCLGRTMGTQDYLGQRVLQVATIFRNLSFGEENQAILATNPTFLRFLLLCMGSRWDSLKQLGMDALGNIAPELQLERLSSDALLQLILSTVTQRLFGPDRAGILGALEVLNKLGQREDNEDAMQRALDANVFEQICRFLTLHDIHVLVYTLECLYSLSSLGEKACNCIVRVHGAVDTLVSLITVEAQSYGPKGCILMRVVETVSGFGGFTYADMQPAQATQADGSQTSGLQSSAAPIKKIFTTAPQPTMIAKTAQIRPAFGGVQVAGSSVSPVVTLHPQLALQQQNPQQPTMFPPQSSQGPGQPLQPTAQPVGLGQSVQQPSVITQAPPASQASVIQHPAAANTVRQTPTPPPQGPPTQLTAQEMVVRENEQFAAAFLRATYENNVASRVEQSEVYNKYLSACAKAGRKGVIAPHHFPKCVRTVFGVTTVPVVKPVVLAGDTTPSGVSRQHFYEGIKVRPKPLSIQLELSESPTVAVALQPQPDPKKRPVAKPKKVATAVAGSAPVVSSTSLETNADPPAPPQQQPPVSVPPHTSFTPSSSILLSQLSAPPKPKDTPTTLENSSQVSTHPHLSQALVGSEVSNATAAGAAAPVANTSAPAATVTVSAPAPVAAAASAGTTNTSLIKSLLATKVNDASIASAPPASMTSGSLTANCNPDTSSSAQVAQRQRMQQQQHQTQTQPISTATATVQTPVLQTVQSQPPTLLQQQLLQPGSQQIDQQTATLLAASVVNNKGKPLRVTRINGARAPTIIQIQGQVEGAEVENHIGGGAVITRRDPPQPPPPPLAPLSSGSNRPPSQDIADGTSVIKCTNSLPSPDDNSSKVGNQSSEGALVNGATHTEVKTEIKLEEEEIGEDSKPVKKGSLMLEDLLEKAVDVKEPPILNGSLSSKDLCISDKGLELVSRGAKTELGKQIRITERGLEVVDSITGAEKELVDMELRLTERGLELVDKQGETAQTISNPQQDNVLQKELSVGEKLLELLEKQEVGLQEEVTVSAEGDVSTCVKRPHEEDEEESDEAKRPKLEVNGNGSWDESSAQGEEKVKASSAAANLYSALAASVLEDEDPDLLMQQEPPMQVAVKEEPMEQPQVQFVESPSTAQPHQLQLVQSGGTLRSVYVSSDPNQSAPQQQQQVVMAGPRQIIVSQGQLTGQSQMLITTAGGQITLQGAGAAAGTATLKTPGGQSVPVLVQTHPGGQAQARASQGVATQFIVSQGPGQGMQQVQLVQSGPGNQIQLATSNASGSQHFVMAQPQTALIQGQPQTVLVTQTPQQQGTAAKTIIILQQQQQQQSGAGAGPAGQVQQKVVAMTPQGQQVVVTPVQRPVIQAGAVSHTPPPALIATSPAASPSQASGVPTGIPTPVLTANPATTPNPAPSLSPAPTITTTSTTTVALPSSSPSIPTPTITANPNASTAPRPNAIRPSPTPSPNPPAPSSSPVPKPNGCVPVSSGVLPSRMGTRSSVAKANMQTTMTTAAPGPASPSATPVASTATKPMTQASTTTNTARPLGGMPNPTPRPSANQSMFLCEWRGCMRSFRSANEVYMHACEAHCPSGSQEIQCLWERCDAMKRKRFSLMTHLYDRHCNADVLRMMAVRRRQLSQSGRSEIPPPQPPPPHPGYAPNAAFHAIKRHALEFVNPKELLHKPGPAPVPPPEQDDNEGPVTKTIRLTAALILRNLVIYSNSGRRILRSYEPHLASVALSNVESSRTVAQVLYDMNDTTGNR